MASTKRQPKHRPEETKDDSAIAELKQTLLQQVMQAEAESARLSKVLREA